jgi:hypothetical protein
MIKTVEAPRDIIGYFQLTSLAAAAQCPGNGSVVMLQAEAQDLRYDPAGGTPTSSVGVLLPAGTTHLLNVGDGNIPNIRIIETAGGGILNVVTFR